MPGNKKIQSISKTTTILDLPDELLLQIFSLLGQWEVFFKLRLVCLRWSNLAQDTSLWKKIVDIVDNVAEDGEILGKMMVTTKVIVEWISMFSYLKHLILNTRCDLNEVLDKVADNCKKLRILEIYCGSGSDTMVGIDSKVLCKMVINCSKLSSINLVDVEFTSCTFFKLILRNIKKKKIKVLHFYGEITYKQLITILQLLRQSVELHEVNKRVQLIFSLENESMSFYNYRLKLDQENIRRFLDIISKKDQKVRIVTTWKWNSYNNYLPDKVEEVKFTANKF